jgi:alcohol dehydrogenase
VTTFRSAEVVSPREPLNLVRRVLPEPGPGEVRVAVQASGICHSDSLFVKRGWPGVRFPVTPGHEIAGYIDAIGDGVQRWHPGDRVAIGWSGGHCGSSRSCRRGDFVLCEDGTITGATTPGGFADYVLAHASALARIPEGMSVVDAAPLACAGVTMFNSLRRTGAGPGDLVAILGIQFAVKMGFRTVAIARGTEKGVLARELGVHHYIDSTASDVAAELQKLGGPRVIQATATNSEAVSAAAAGLGPNGELITLAAVVDPVHVSPAHLISISGTVHGHPGGASPDVEDTLNFAELQGIKPMVEVLPVGNGGRGLSANDGEPGPFPSGPHDNELRIARPRPLAD